MIEVLTGVFSGVLCALISGSFGFVKSRGKRFDFWILIAGAIFGISWVALNANAYFTLQEWLLTIAVLALLEYGGNAYWRTLHVQTKIDRGYWLIIAFIAICAVIAIIWVVSFFVWLKPLYDNQRFAFYEVGENATLVWRWFANDVPQMERDAVGLWFILGIPITATVTLVPLGLYVQDKIRKFKKKK
jgi:hypothetical protein